MTTFYFTQNDQIVEVRLSSDELVNAWSGSVVLPEAVKTHTIITADTVTDIWQTIPKLEGRRIVFTGGKPNGFEGDGLLFKLILGGGDYTLDFFSDTEAYLNDGLGTEAKAVLQPLEYKLGVGAVELVVDTTPPEPFTLELYRKEDLFDGKPVVIFSAEDVDSGVVRYEVRETIKTGKGDWHIAESPYLVNEDVEKLEIKAIDAFGNERIEVVRITPVSPAAKVFFVAIILLGIAFVLYNSIRKWKKKK